MTKMSLYVLVDKMIAAGFDAEIRTQYIDGSLHMVLWSGLEPQVKVRVGGMK